MLYSLEALDKEGRLTRSGRLMSRFPVDPMGARAILHSSQEGCLDDVIAIIAMLSTEHSVFLTAHSDEEESGSSRAHKRFIDRDGDQLTLLNAFNAYR